MTRIIDDFGGVQCKYCENWYLDEDDLAQHESSIHGDTLGDYWNDRGMFRLIVRSSGIDEFYTELKKKMTGQVINGVLIGCLLEPELEEVYEQFKQSEGNSEKDS